MSFKTSIELNPSVIRFLIVGKLFCFNFKN